MNKWYIKREVLTPEEEFELGTRVVNGDEDAIEELILSNMRLALFLAESYHSSSCPLTQDDLVSEAMRGLTDACKRYNPEKGKFSTYASFWIKERMNTTILEQSGFCRIPVGASKYRNKLKTFITSYKEEHGVHPALEDIYEEFPNVPNSKLEKLLHVIDVVYLDASFPDDQASSVGDTISNAMAEMPYDNIIKEDHHNMLESLISSCLNEREQFIIKKTYGLLEETAVYAELGTLLNISPQRVSQIHNMAILKLRKELKSQL